MKSHKPQKNQTTPQNPEVEEAVLGSLLLESEYALTEVVDILKVESFYKEKHKKIYQAILNAYNNGKPVDILTVYEELRKKNQLEEVGGAYEVAKITHKVQSSANAKAHARILVESQIKRQLIKVASAALEKSYKYDTDCFELLDEVENGIFKISAENTKQEVKPIEKLVLPLIDKLGEGKNEDGVPSGFRDLDRFTSGWQKQDLIICAARPGMGKTAFCLNMAENAATLENPVAFFSLEMSAEKLFERLLAGRSEIDGDKMRSRNFEREDLDNLYQKSGFYYGLPLFIDDTAGISILELRAKARRLKRKHGIKLIIIDYMQLITTHDKKVKNREQEVSLISRSLKQLAKEIDVPIIALSQLSRMLEIRGGEKRPQLSDLRESGAIEQDADIVFFLYRPEYYGIDEDMTGRPTEGLTEIIIAKHRNGSTGTAYAKFKSRFTKFTEWEQPHEDVTQELQPF